MTMSRGGNRDLADAIRHHRDGNIGRAAKLYRRAIDKSAGHFLAYHHLSIIEAQAANFAIAESLNRKALELRPADPDVWLVRGNVDPKAVMTQYKHLISAAHVKDLAPEGECLDEDGWADVGYGRLDWKDLWGFSRGLGARWMVLEHDKPNDAARFASRSADFLRKTVA